MLAIDLVRTTQKEGVSFNFHQKFPYALQPSRKQQC